MCILWIHMKDYRKFSFLSLLLSNNLINDTCSALLNSAMRSSDSSVLAPTRQQRLRFQDWLRVYAKDRSSLSTRMATLVDQYKVNHLSNSLTVHS